MCDCRKQHALSQPSKASFNFKKMIFGMGSGVAKIIFLKREIGNSNQFYRNTAKNYLPVAVILKVRRIIKVWRRFLTRTRTQTFFRKRFAQSHLRAAAPREISAAALGRKMDFCEQL